MTVDAIVTRIIHDMVLKPGSTYALKQFSWFLLQVQNVPAFSCKCCTQYDIMWQYGIAANYNLYKPPKFCLIHFSLCTLFLLQFLGLQDKQINIHIKINKVMSSVPTAVSDFSDGLSSTVLPILGFWRTSYKILPRCWYPKKIPGSDIATMTILHVRWYSPTSLFCCQSIVLP